MRPLRLLTLLTLALLAACTGAVAPPPSGPQLTAPPPFLTDRLAPTLPAVAARRAAIAAALAAEPPILTRTGLDPDAAAAQAQVLRDPRILAATHTVAGTGPLLIEVFGVVPTKISDLTTTTNPCRERRCFKVVLYNFATNTTLTAITDQASGSVLDVNSLSGVQPDIPPHLAELAVAIAQAAPAVQRELDMAPPADMAIYEAVKASLGGSPCERSGHLCVAPTFPWGRGALWAVVDLTDLALIGGGVWTDLGATSGRRVSETMLQDAVVSGLCDRSEALAWGPWHLEYTLGSSDGLIISNVTFNAQPWLTQAKLVDWHVRYPSRADGIPIGYADAAGCPTFSSASVLPHNLPFTEPISDANGVEVGVALVQDFRMDPWPIPCNYRYQNRYELYRDGRFRMLAVAFGRPCGLGGVYRPILRIVPAGVAHTVAAWDGTAWQPWTSEGWTTTTTTPAAADGSRLRIAATRDGPTLLLRPTDDPRPDAAFVYISRHQPAEGDADLATLGTCCSETYQQGPEGFIEPAEPLAGEPITLWYIPQMPNVERAACWADTVLRDGVFVAETWPCVAGPWLVPAP